MPALLAAAGILFLAASIATPFYTKGEPREAIVVQALLSGGSAVLPLRNGNEIPSKPPLFHWLGALASRLSGGVSEASVRLPSVAASVATIGLTVALGIRLWGLGAGLAAGAILASSQQWIASSVTARVDMVLAFCVTAAVASFISARSEDRRMGWAFYAAAAAAVLTKGPVGIVLPILVLAVCLVCRRDRAYLGKLSVARGLPWLVLPLLWYLAAYGEGGQAFLDKLILKENFYRVLDPEKVGAGHIKSMFFYFPALLAGMAPWSLFLPAVGIQLWKRGKQTQSDGTLYPLVWFLVTLVLFSLAGSKRGVYLLPAYPALALLLGHWWADLGRGRVEPGTTVLVLLRTALVLVAVTTATAMALIVAQVAGLPIFETFARLASTGDAANLRALAGLLSTRTASSVIISAWAALSLVLAGVMLASAWRRNWQPAFVAIVLLVAATVATASASLYRDLAHSQSLAGFAPTITAEVPAGTPLYFYRDLEKESPRTAKLFESYHYAAVFYAARPIPVVTNLNSLATPAYLLVAGRLDHGWGQTVVATYDWNGNKARDVISLVRLEQR